MKSNQTTEAASSADGQMRPRHDAVMFSASSDLDSLREASAQTIDSILNNPETKILFRLGDR